MARWILLVCVAMALVSCAGFAAPGPVPTPDVLGTQMAMNLKFATTRTAEAQTGGSTPEGTATGPAGTEAAGPTATPEPGATATEATSYSAGDIWTRAADGMDMVYVPAGELILGSNSTDEALAALSRAEQTAYLDGFWIDRFEVTNAQYQDCITAGACQEPEPCRGEEGPGPADHPVVCVTWDEALAYCTWAGAQLPSEDEWEKAARGTDGRLYPWGNRWDAAKCNTEEAGPGGTTAVGAYSPAGDSFYGCADMAGNAWEWVDAWYGDSPVDMILSTAPNALPAPKVPDPESCRVVRGGSWGWNRYAAASASRFGADPGFRAPGVGFRCSAPAGVAWGDLNRATMALTTAPGQAPSASDAGAMLIAAGQTMGLGQAISAGLVRATVRGRGASSGDSIVVELTRQVQQDLELTIEPGTVLVSEDPSKQDMVVVRWCPRPGREPSRPPCGR